MAAVIAFASCAAAGQNDAPAPPPQPRVVLLRGALGVFSRGLDTLADRCRAEGMTVSIHSYTQWSSIADGLLGEAENAGRPLVLIGHSFGADAVLAMADRLRQHHRYVALAVTLESVAHTHAPGNIDRALNIYSGRTLYSPIPLWRGLPLDRSANVENINLRERTDLALGYTGHGNIDDNARVHEYVLGRIRELSVPASTGTAVNSSPGVPPAGAPSGVPWAVRSGVIYETPDTAPPTMSLRIATPETGNDVPPLRARIDEPLAIPGGVPRAPYATGPRETGYSPTAGLRPPSSRPALAERSGDTQVPAQPASRGSLR